MRRRLRLWLAVSILPALAAVCIGAVFGWWLLRPNTARVNPRLTIEHWPVVSDGMHNSNTDLLYWRGYYYLVHASSPWHLGSTKCQLLLWRSRDARSWESVRSFYIPGSDIRDPKFKSFLKPKFKSIDDTVLKVMNINLDNITSFEVVDK